MFSPMRNYEWTLGLSYELQVEARKVQVSMYQSLCGDDDDNDGNLLI